MIVEIRDAEGYSHIIDSANPATVGLWFFEQAQRLMSVNASMGQSMLIVRPMTDKEREYMRDGRQVEANAVLLEEFAKALLGL